MAVFFGRSWSSRAATADRLRSSVALNWAVSSVAPLLTTIGSR